MNLDAELMFECLIYLNLFYFPVFASCEFIITLSKYLLNGKLDKEVLNCQYLERDAAVIFTRLTSEFTKIMLYRKFKEERRDFITGIAVFFTYITLVGLCYGFLIQDPFFKLEKILNILTLLLASTEIAFGTLQILIPCFQKDPYY